MALPATARADGIDLPILIGYGVGIILPLFLFNAKVEAPIIGRLLGIKFSELWWPWFKANVWSLLSGIPVLAVTSMLKEWWVPTELGARVRVYAIFLIACILVFLSVTVLVEFLYARRLVWLTHGCISTGRIFNAVILANLASYVVLGPVFYLLEYPRTDIRRFTANTLWAKQPALSVVAIGPDGHLEAARADGQNPRVVIPYEVRDYVVSSNLALALYRGAEDRFYLYGNSTNLLIPELAFWCRASEMDFSPGGRFAAFVGAGKKGLLAQVYDSKSGKLRDVPFLGAGSDYKLAWSSREESFYLRSGKEYLEISLASEVRYTPHTQTPTDLADHYGRVGTSWSRDGAFYASHQDGALKLFVVHGWGSRLSISNQKESIMQIKDPAGTLGVQQAVFLGGDEVLLELGGYVYLADIATKRIGPVMQGQKSIALAAPYSKSVDF